MPSTFPKAIATDKQLGIKARSTAVEITTAFAASGLGPVLEAALDSPEFKRVVEIRNVLVHRSVPMRDLAIDPDTHSVRAVALQFQIHGGRPAVIEPALTAEARAWLMTTVSLLARQLAAFMRQSKQAHLLQPDGGHPESFHSQPVTPVDRAQGRIRLPHDAKSQLPSFATRIRIRLRGEQLEVAYDPRFGPDRERSATLTIPRKTLQRLLRDDEILELRAG